ncbi:hypothetical protein LAZ67_12003571 [Cordylochernes scorpioides]|uniref:Mariner transposase n=1 Tax=Cordylochernes scorpioides TaxID=51811 RepID=A0ABY6L550_9ARAC|nr:hypothetical protein LAZ67_12003571 [Cordylochernes scorpioides]
MDDKIPEKETSALDKVAINSQLCRRQDGKGVVLKAGPAEDPSLQVRGPPYDVEGLSDERPDGGTAPVTVAEGAVDGPAGRTGGADGGRMGRMGQGVEGQLEGRVGLVARNCGDHTLLQRARTGTKLHFTHGQWTASATASVNLTTHARTSRLWPLTRRKLMRVIVVYDDHALVDRTCQKWFARFKSSNFDLEDKERPRALLKFEEARLDEDARQTQKELTKTLGVTQPAILLRLKEIGMIRRVGNWVPCELKPRDVECRFSREKLLQRPK